MIKKTETKKIEKGFKKGTLIVRDFSQDDNVYNYNNYINISYCNAPANFPNSVKLNVSNL